MKPAAEIFKRNYSQVILKAIDWAMDPDPRLRPQNSSELLAMLKSLPAELPLENYREKLFAKLGKMLPWKNSSN
jgi:hypothetical protein